MNLHQGSNLCLPPQTIPELEARVVECRCRLEDARSLPRGRRTNAVILAKAALRWAEKKLAAAVE